MENTQTSPKPFVFVLMPFSKEFDDIYKLGIKAACEESGMYCERVDEQQFDGTVLDRIYKQIATASLIVADMTGRNPNVFYEVGYAHALNKRVILLTQKAEDIPFDLKHYPHIVYQGSILSLKDELAKRLKWANEQQDKVSEYFTTSIQPYIDNCPVIDNPTIYLKRYNHSRAGFDMVFQNTTKKSIHSVVFWIGIILHETIEIEDLEYRRTNAKTYKSDNQSQLWIIKNEIKLLPDMWEKIHVGIATQGNNKNDCCLRLFTETASHDFPFKIEFKD